MSQLSTGAAQIDDALVGVGISLTPRRQSRLTVFFRGILIIPFLIALYFFAIAAEIMLVIGWFAALFLGRMPEGISSFLSTYLQWDLELSAYASLLTARWPFLGGPARGPKPMFSPAHEPLNRLAVFFRILLVFPAAIVGSIFALGNGVWVILMWFGMLITGKSPKSMHQSVALGIRYRLRLSGYLMMLTPMMPWHGIFGDAVGDEEPSHDEVSLTTEEPSDESAVAVTQLVDPRQAWTVSSGGVSFAKIALGFGAVLYVLSTVLSSVLVMNAVNAANKTAQKNAVQTSYLDTYQEVYVNLPQNVPAMCQTLTCKTGAMNESGNNVLGIISVLDETSFPARVNSQLNTYRGDLETVANTLIKTSSEKTDAAVSQDLKIVSQAMTAALHDGVALNAAIDK